MRARPLPLALAAANCGALLLALWPWLAPAGDARTTALPPPQRTAAADAIPKLPPAHTFAAIAERPLFAPTRRPDAAAPATATGLAAQYRLLGVILAQGKGRVLLAPAGGGRVIELAPGDRIAGWRLRRVEQDRAVFASPIGEATLRVAPAPRR